MKKQPAAPKKPASRAKAAVPKKNAGRAKAAAPKKKAAPKHAAAGAGPTTAAELAPDSEWAIGPYGELLSKKDFAPVATRTRVS